MPWINSICKEFLFEIICGVQNIVCGIIMQDIEYMYAKRKLATNFGFSIVNEKHLHIGGCYIV